MNQQNWESIAPLLEKAHVERGPAEGDGASGAEREGSVERASGGAWRTSPRRSPKKTGKCLVVFGESLTCGVPVLESAA